MPSRISDLTTISTLLNTTNIAVENTGESSKKAPFSLLKSSILEDHAIGGTADNNIALMEEVLKRGQSTDENKIIVYDSDGNATPSASTVSDLEPKDNTILKEADLSDSISLNSSTTPASSKAVFDLKNSLLQDYTSITPSVTYTDNGEQSDNISFSLANFTGIESPIGNFEVEYYFEAGDYVVPGTIDWSTASKIRKQSNVIQLAKPVNGDAKYTPSNTCKLLYRYRFVGTGTGNYTSWIEGSVASVTEPYRFGMSQLLQALASADASGTVDERNAQDTLNNLATAIASINSISKKIIDTVSQQSQ